jgi:hypothetical protein
VIQFWNNSYFENVASDFITLALVVGAGGIYYRLSRRRRLLRFFECTSSQSLTIYLSRLQIDYGTAIDLDGNPRSYSGPAVPGYEIDLTRNAYRSFLAPVPGLEDQRGFFRFFALRDLQLFIRQSPADVGGLTTTGTIIAVGSRHYNAASLMAETHEREAYATLNGAVLLFRRVRGEAPTDCSGPDRALIQKTYHSARGQWLFEVAGSTARATREAYDHLLRHWASLYSDYGSGVGSGFALIIEVGPKLGSGVSRLDSTVPEDRAGA